MFESSAPYRTIPSLFGALLLVLAPLEWAYSLSRGHKRQIDTRPYLKHRPGRVDRLLFRTSDGFLKDRAKAIARVRGSIHKNEGRRLLLGVEPGIHPVTVQRDENGAAKHDTNMLGVLQKVRAVFNNAPAGHFGPPSSNDESFVFNGGVHLLEAQAQAQLLNGETKCTKQNG